MAGFGNIVGFMMIFFMLSFLFISVFYMYESELVDRVSELESFEKNTLKANFYAYSISSPFSSSGRLYLDILNTGKLDLKFIEGNEQCFSIFLDDEFISQQNFLIYLNADLSVNYKIIETSGEAILLIDKILDSSFEHKLKLISCEDVSKTYLVEIGKIDWWDENWDERKEIVVLGTENVSLAEYQLELDLTSSNFDFLNGKMQDLRFILALKENLVLDLTYDEYKQNLNDFSNLNIDVSLGDSNGIELSDPTEVSSGLLLGALDFDGDDFVNLSNIANYNNSLGFTFATWLKWNGVGDSIQTIYSNGVSGNSLSIVNDGGVNHKSLQFDLNISGTINTLYSNISLDNSWHFISAIYDEDQMYLYVDGNLAGILSISGDLIYLDGNSYIGTSSVLSDYYNGSIDETKLLNLPLDSGEVIDLFYDHLRFRELDYFVASWDASIEEAKIFVKLPYLHNSSNITFHMYYNSLISLSNVSSVQSIENTFSYRVPRTVAYVVNDEIYDDKGLSILSLRDDNIIEIDNDVFNLDEQASGTLASGSISSNDVVNLKYLANVEGDGGGTDMINPISWAGFEFSYFRFNENPDTFCVLSPFGSTTVNFYLDGAFSQGGVVDETGNCFTGVNYASADGVFINSSIYPVLIHYNGRGSQDRDAFALYPLTQTTFYGRPARNLRVATGPDGSDVIWYNSISEVGVFNLASFATASVTGIGLVDGVDIPAYKLISGGKINVLQDNDGDGAEMSVFVPEYEMGTKFGSNEAIDFILAVSPYSNANCSTFDSGGTLVDTLSVGGGINGVYNYTFGNIGTDTTYLTSRWKFECEKPVWLFAERTNNDEVNLFGYMQMRQYIYPEPVISIS